MKLKLKLIEIYNEKLKEREERKSFVFDRGVLVRHLWPSPPASHSFHATPPYSTTYRTSASSWPVTDTARHKKQLCWI